MKRLALLSVALTSALASAGIEEAPVEFGQVDWGRKLEPALQASQKTGTPIWLQFQEVPG